MDNVPWSAYLRGSERLLTGRLSIVASKQERQSRCVVLQGFAAMDIDNSLVT